MNQFTFAWILIGIYGVVAVRLAHRGFQQTRTLEDFVVGNRDVSPVYVGLSLTVQLTSVATFVINPGLIYAYGLSALLGMGVAGSLGLLLGLIVLSKGFRKVGEDLAVLTVPGWLGRRYRSRNIQIGFSLLSLALTSFIVLIVVAISHVMTGMLQIPGWTVVVGVLTFVFGYVLFGGVTTSVWTNSIQAVVMIIAACLLFCSGLTHFSGGVEALFTKLTAIDGHLASVVNTKSLYFRNVFEVFICNFLVGMALVCQPHVMNKTLYLKSNNDLNKYLITALCVGCLFMTVMITGIYARLVLPPVSHHDWIIPIYIQSQFPPMLGVIVSLGIICAGISTLEGVLLSLSGILATDLFMPSLRHWLSFRTLENRNRIALKLTRFSLVGLGGIALALSLKEIAFPRTESLAIFAQYGVYCLFSATFAPMLFGILRQSGSSFLAGLASIVALVVFFGVAIGKVTSMYNNPAVLSALSILSSVLVMGMGTIFRYLTFRAAKRRVENWSRREPRSIQP